MKLSLHGVIALTALAMTGVGLAVTHPKVFHRLALDVWTLPGDSAELESQQERQKELDKQGELVSRRFALKTNIVRELIAGRTTVADAAEQFAALNKIEPEIDSMTMSTYPAKSSVEAAALQVIRFAKTELRSEPGNNKNVMARLTKEIEEMTGRQLVLHGEHIGLVDKIAQ